MSRQERILNATLAALPPEVGSEVLRSYAHHRRVLDSPVMGRLQEFGVGTGHSFANALYGLATLPVSAAHAVGLTDTSPGMLFGPGGKFDDPSKGYGLGNAYGLGGLAGFLASLPVPAGVLGKGANAVLAPGRASMLGTGARAARALNFENTLANQVFTQGSRLFQGPGVSARQALKAAQQSLPLQVARGGLHFGLMTGARTPGSLEERAGHFAHGIWPGMVFGAFGRPRGILARTGSTADDFAVLHGKAADRFITQQGGLQAAYRKGMIGGHEPLSRFLPRAAGRGAVAGSFTPGFSPVEITGNPYIDSSLFNAAFFSVMPLMHARSQKNFVNREQAQAIFEGKTKKVEAAVRPERGNYIDVENPTTGKVERQYFANPQGNLFESAEPPVGPSQAVPFPGARVRTAEGRLGVVVGERLNRRTGEPELLVRHDESVFDPKVRTKEGKGPDDAPLQHTPPEDIYFSRRDLRVVDHLGQEYTQFHDPAGGPGRQQTQRKLPFEDPDSSLTTDRFGEVVDIRTGQRRLLDEQMGIRRNPLTGRFERVQEQRPLFESDAEVVEFPRETGDPAKAASEAAQKDQANQFNRGLLDAQGIEASERSGTVRPADTPRFKVNLQAGERVQVQGRGTGTIEQVITTTEVDPIFGEPFAPTVRVRFEDGRTVNVSAEALSPIALQKPRDPRQLPLLAPRPRATPRLDAAKKRHAQRKADENLNDARLELDTDIHGAIVVSDAIASDTRPSPALTQRVAELTAHLPPAERLSISELNSGSWRNLWERMIDVAANGLTTKSDRAFKNTFDAVVEVVREDFGALPTTIFPKNHTIRLEFDRNHRVDVDGWASYTPHDRSVRIGPDILTLSPESRRHKLFHEMTHERTMAVRFRDFLARFTNQGLSEADGLRVVAAEFSRVGMGGRVVELPSKSGLTPEQDYKRYEAEREAFESSLAYHLNGDFRVLATYEHAPPTMKIDPATNQVHLIDNMNLRVRHVRGDLAPKDRPEMFRGDVLDMLTEGNPVGDPAVTAAGLFLNRLELPQHIKPSTAARGRWANRDPNGKERWYLVEEFDPSLPASARNRTLIPGNSHSASELLGKQVRPKNFDVIFSAINPQFLGDIRNFTEGNAAKQYADPFTGLPSLQPSNADPAPFAANHLRVRSSEIAAGNYGWTNAFELLAEGSVQYVSSNPRTVEVANPGLGRLIRTFYGADIAIEGVSNFRDNQSQRQLLDPVSYGPETPLQVALLVPPGPAFGGNPSFPVIRKPFRDPTVRLFSKPNRVDVSDRIATERLGKRIQPGEETILIRADGEIGSKFELADSVTLADQLQPVNKRFRGKTGEVVGYRGDRALIAWGDGEPVIMAERDLAFASPEATKVRRRAPQQIEIEPTPGAGLTKPKTKSRPPKKKVQPLSSWEDTGTSTPLYSNEQRLVDGRTVAGLPLPTFKRIKPTKNYQSSGFEFTGLANTAEQAQAALRILRGHAMGNGTPRVTRAGKRFRYTLTAKPGEVTMRDAQKASTIRARAQDSGLGEVAQWVTNRWLRSRGYKISDANDVAAPRDLVEGEKLVLGGDRSTIEQALGENLIKLAEAEGGQAAVKNLIETVFDRAADSMRVRPLADILSERRATTARQAAALASGKLPKTVTPASDAVITLDYGDIPASSVVLPNKVASGKQTYKTAAGAKRAATRIARKMGGEPFVVREGETYYPAINIRPKPTKAAPGEAKATTRKSSWQGKQEALEAVWEDTLRAEAENLKNERGGPKLVAKKAKRSAAAASRREALANADQLQTAELTGQLEGRSFEGRINEKTAKRQDYLIELAKLTGDAVRTIARGEGYVIKSARADSAAGDLTIGIRYAEVDALFGSRRRALAAAQRLRRAVLADREGVKKASARAVEVEGGFKAIAIIDSKVAERAKAKPLPEKAKAKAEPQTEAAPEGALRFGGETRPAEEPVEAPPQRALVFGEGRPASPKQEAEVIERAVVQPERPPERALDRPIETVDLTESGELSSTMADISVEGRGIVPDLGRSGGKRTLGEGAKALEERSKLGLEEGDVIFDTNKLAEIAQIEFLNKLRRIFESPEALEAAIPNEFQREMVRLSFGGAHIGGEPLYTRVGKDGLKEPWAPPDFWFDVETHKRASPAKVGKKLGRARSTVSNRMKAFEMSSTQVDAQAHLHGVTLNAFDALTARQTTTPEAKKTVASGQDVPPDATHVDPVTGKAYRREAPEHERRAIVRERIAAERKHGIEGSLALEIPPTESVPERILVEAEAKERQKVVPFSARAGVRKPSSDAPQGSLFPREVAAAERRAAEAERPSPEALYEAQREAISMVGRRGMGKVRFARLPANLQLEHAVRRILAQTTDTAFRGYVRKYAASLKENGHDLPTLEGLVPVLQAARPRRSGSKFLNLSDAVDYINDASERYHVEYRPNLRSRSQVEGKEPGVVLRENDTGKVIELDNLASAAIYLDLRNQRLQRDAPDLTPEVFKWLKIKLPRLTPDDPGGPGRPGPPDRAADGESGGVPPSGRGPLFDRAVTMFAYIRDTRSLAAGVSEAFKKRGVPNQLFEAFDQIVNFSDLARHASNTAVGEMKRIAKKHGVKWKRRYVIGKAASELDIRATRISIAEGQDAARRWVERNEVELYRSMGLNEGDIAFLREMRPVWDKLFADFGIGVDQYIHGYFTRYAERKGDPLLDPIERHLNEVTPDAGLRFFSEMERTGELQGRSLDYFGVFAHYANSGYRHKFLGRPAGIDRRGAIEWAQTELDRLKAGGPPERWHTALERALQSAQGVMDPRRVDAIEATKNRTRRLIELEGKAATFIAKTNLPGSELVSRAIRKIWADHNESLSDRHVTTLTDMFLTLHRSRTFGLNAMRAVRHVTQSLFFVMPRVGFKAYSQAVKEILDEGSVVPATSWTKWAQSNRGLGTIYHDALTAGVLKPAFMNDFSTSRHKWLNKLEALSFIYRDLDVWERVVSFRAQQIVSNKALRLYKKTGDINDYIRESNLEILHPAFIRRVLDPLKRGNHVEAISQHARLLVDHAIFDYSTVNAPYAFRGQWGRLFGQYGRWPLAAAETMAHMTTYGPLSKRAGIAVRYAGAAASVYSLGVLFGVRTGDWIPFLHSIGYTGGPGWSMFTDAYDVLGGDPFKQEQWLENWKKDPVASMFSIPLKTMVPAGDLYRGLASELNFGRRRRRLMGLLKPADSTGEIAARMVGFRSIEDEPHAGALIKKPFKFFTKPMSEWIKETVRPDLF